jgi:hypothetical protein
MSVGGQRRHSVVLAVAAGLGTPSRSAAWAAQKTQAPALPL